MIIQHNFQIMFPSLRFVKSL